MSNIKDMNDSEQHSLQFNLRVSRLAQYMKGPFPGKWLCYIFLNVRMTEDNIPIDYNFYDKMSIITFLSFRSTRFIMDFVIFDRKKNMSHQFYYFLPNFFYNLPAVIYDNFFLTSLRRNM